MYVAFMTAGYVREVLHMMQEFKLRQARVLVLDKEGDPNFIEIDISPEGNSFAMHMVPDNLNQDKGEEVIYCETKKGFIEKFKSSKMYMLEIVKTEHVG